MKSKVIEIYGTGSANRAAKALGLSRQRIEAWPDVLMRIQVDSIIAALYRKKQPIPEWLLKN